MAFSLKKITFFIFLIMISLIGTCSVNSAFAQSGPDTGTPTQGSGQDNGVREVTTVKLDNPLNNIDSIEDLIVAILNIFITLMIPVIVFFIILAGFKYVTAQGNPGKIEEATQTFMYVVIGGVLILAAVAIAEIIKNTVQAF